MSARRKAGLTRFSVAALGVVLAVVGSTEDMERWSGLVLFCIGIFLFGFGLTLGSKKALRDPSPEEHLRRESTQDYREQ